MKQTKAIAILLICLFSFFGESGFAEKTSNTQEITENEKRAGFTVQAVLPENQINDRIGYYHLLVQPNGRQTVDVKIFNTSEKKQTYKVEVINAATNRNGLITYDERDKKPDASMKLPITEVAKPKNKEVSVDAYSEGKAEIELNVPAEPFSGIVLGGIRISLKPEKEEESENGMSVKNTYGYAIGMILTENKETPIYGETELKLTELKPEIDYGSKVLEARIQNPHPEALQELEAEGKITKKGSSKTIAKNTLKNIKIAPNSIFPFQIDWGMQEVAAGDYTFTGKVKGETTSWAFSKDFTITRALAKKMNKQTAFRVFIPEWWTNTFYGFVLVTVLLVLFLGYRLIKRKKKEEGDE
ncbi:DUF916 and DUF3324 domain-containing protein [Candidatus Enterococcus murrayae]|uniref:DUF916 and DUF3324 domain-containing protein n=1 Tax=Candidatus Enterococcus murrayae TaxID=2815321 RepID=A0ABS3HF06_9ENTE|nr:DUF916 and DUF3324 domain-containing protein [Enterococcus sp. MJM16]MBO0452026.1 DUF916 and DUF3324 domain-containing protein [Enterococcus sp. MJM16]